VLRECHRLLKPDATVAGYTIHTPEGLSPTDQQRAVELGPSAVNASKSPANLVREVGLAVIYEKDVTEVFRSSCESLVRAREELEEQLRAAQGDEVYEEELGKKRDTLLGISEGLLLRSLTVAKKG
jgi:hypothetical protein